MAYPNQQPSSTTLPYPHSHAYPYLYAPHPHSNLSSSSSTTPSFTPYSTPPTTAPPSPTSTNTHAINLQRYYHHLNTFHNHPSDHNHNMHHQSHPHLFPEQIQSASSFRPPSSQSHHSAGNGTSTAAAAGASSYAQPGTHSGPALQVAHPTAAANALDIYRHRSASPWVPPHQQQQQHASQSHQQLYGSNNAGHSSSSSAATGASSLFNPSSYQSHHSQPQSHSQHPLAQQHNHHHNPYSFPSHYNNGHDPYHSPETSHATLPYGFPAHPPYHHHHHSSSYSASLLDKHLISSSSSNSRSNTPSHHHHPYGSSSNSNNHKYPHQLQQSESNVRSKIDSKSASGGDKLPKMRITSSGSGSATSAAGGGGGTTSAKGSKGAKEGSSETTPGAAANYGIVDETSTTLFDLRDGPDGPRGKPPYPYLTLIRIALISAPAKKLTLQELYDTLETRWPGHFAGDQKGWKNSIRHNLSLNKCFKKEARHILDPGKGAYWYCDINEEHSTPRVRNRKKGEGEGEYDAEGEFVQPHPSGSKRGASTKAGGAKKRKAESPHSGLDGDHSDTYRSQPGYKHDDYTSASNDYWSSAQEAHARSVKLRVGDLRLPFNFTSSASNTGMPLAKRQRAISAPSPITPSFFNNFTSAIQAGHTQSKYEPEEEIGDLGLAPFGMTSVGAVHQSSNNNNGYESQQPQPYAFPQLFNQPNQLQVPKYEFPSSNSYSGGSTHQLPTMPSLIGDKALESGSTESSFALETPRTIYSSTNPGARPGTANSTNNGSGGAGKAGMERSPKEEANSIDDLAQMPGAHDGNVSGNVNGSSDNTPGPAQSYVFPATQRGSAEPGQSKRVFVNPPGTATVIAMLKPTSSSVSPHGAHQSPPQQYLQGGVRANEAQHNNSHHTLPASSIPAHPNVNSSNPFAAPHNVLSSNQDLRNRPEPLHINSKDGKNVFSPPSATSPTRHLNSEYGDMFSTAPFGLIFDAPSGKGTGRKGSLFGGLTAR